MIHLLKHLLTVKSDQLHVLMPTDYNVEECMKPQMRPIKNLRQGLKKHRWAELLSNEITFLVVKSFFNELKFTQGN